MIYVKNTPNNTGVAIYGDALDFEGVYEALHIVVGDEYEFITHDAARIRVLGVCYDLRHALQGDREIEFVDNGMTEDKMKWMSIIAPDKNVYLKINVLWPEMLFVTMALNDFIRLYAKKIAKKTYFSMTSNKIIWNHEIAQVRLFQAATVNCIRETVTESSFSRMINLMNREYIWTEGYTTQYLDILNCKFIEMDRDRRIRNISKTAKQLAEQGSEYQKIRAEVLSSARHYNTTEDNIRPIMQYPEEIEW